ncbi:hypothetical protein BH11ARM2_BH11ARM2_25390 [soil metagenome]
MKCPNCGEEFEGRRCPHCGHPDGGSTFNRILAVVVVVFLALPLGLVGACGAYVGLAGLVGPDSEGLVIGAGVGLVGGGLSYGLFLLARNLWK